MAVHKRKTILLGEGIHQHTLVGEFEVDDNVAVADYPQINVRENSQLLHEKPNGGWSGEHKTLPIRKGGYVMGMQVEYNPFSQSVSRVWD
jgi:hypothetical protein